MRRAALWAAATALLVAMASFMQQSRRDEGDTDRVLKQHMAPVLVEKELKWPNGERSFVWPGRKGGGEKLQDETPAGEEGSSRTQLLLADDRKALALSRLARKNMQDLMRQHLQGKDAIEGRLLKEEASRQINKEEAQDLEAERLRSAIHAFEHGVPAAIARKFSRVRSELKSSAQGVGTSAASSLKHAQRDFESALKGSMSRRKQALQSSATYEGQYRYGDIDWHARYAQCWPHCAPENNVYEHVRTWKYPYDERHGGHTWRTWPIKSSGVDRAYRAAEQSGRRGTKGVDSRMVQARMQASAGFDMNVYWTKQAVDLQSAEALSAGSSNVSLYAMHADLTDKHSLLSSVNQSTNGLFVWSGYIFVEHGGEYTFTLDSDSESAVWIDNQQLMTAHDEKKTATILLLPGFHFFKAIFCKVASQHVMSVKYFGPDTGGVERLVKGFHDFNELPKPQVQDTTHRSSDDHTPHSDPDAPVFSHSSFHHVKPEVNVWDHISDQYDSPSSGRRWSDPASDPQGYYVNVLGNGNDGDFVPLYQAVPAPAVPFPPPPSPSQDTPMPSEDATTDGTSETMVGMNEQSAKLDTKGKLQILHQLANKRSSKFAIDSLQTPKAKISDKNSARVPARQLRESGSGYQLKQTSKLIAINGWEGENGDLV
eukprot:747778-Hanusia_phi.AAC.4